ncbi:MAG: methylated-DNA--[protein]-cysteine S-methyltransferase [Actinomycetota bacterium]|nr:methylated-DNA--[protein]-cysteine S-methyltransferase [Actinomycetota bacterium]
MTNELTTISVEEARIRTRRADQALIEAAEDAGLIDVALGTMDSPVGELLLAVTSRGLACVAYDDQDRDRLLDRFARELSPRVLRSTGPTDEARHQLEQYFAGKRRGFELTLDRRLMGSFARTVLEATARVPFGQVSTYGRVATEIARPHAARAVGAALGSNPIPIVVPCHRIVGASGKLTGYAGGLHRKEYLLHLEGEPRLFQA